MKFSVIIPLYNKAKYVVKAIGSVVNQTYEDWELIIVNDGSKDDSLQVVQDYLVHHPDDRIRLLDQTNGGVSVARNNGIRDSKGEYVCFLDADDWWSPEYLECLSEMINQYGSHRIGIFATNYYCVTHEQKRIGVTFVEWIEKKCKGIGIMDYWTSYLKTTGGMPLWTGAVCVPRKILEMDGYSFPIGIAMGEDFLLWAQIVLRYQIIFNERPLAYYNFDAEVGNRAIKKLHAPESNMLFNMHFLEEYGEKNEVIKQLLDKLRVVGLLRYHISKKYHDAAKMELKKVHWEGISSNYRRLYHRPIVVVRIQFFLLEVGSRIKHKLIKCKKKWIK